MTETKKKQPANAAFSRYHVPNLVRALRVFEFLADRPEGVGVSEIAEEMGIPKNSAFRIAATLSDYGYLLRDEPTAMYRLSPKLLTLGYAAVDQEGLIEKSTDVLRALRDETGETALLAVLAGHEGVVLDQRAGTHPIKVVVEVGCRFPMHSAAPGKAILAFLPEDERNAILDNVCFTRFTENTITDRKVYINELAGVAKLGYAVDRGEEDITIACVSAPVFNRVNRPIAAIWITAPMDRLPETRFCETGKRVVAHADRISARFGRGCRWKRTPGRNGTATTSACRTRL
jgi:DNA-binding IclR family transcriptional regulator